MSAYRLARNADFKVVDQARGAQSAGRDDHQFAIAGLRCQQVCLLTDSDVIGFPAMRVKFGGGFAFQSGKVLFLGLDGISNALQQPVKAQRFSSLAQVK